MDGFDDEEFDIALATYEENTGNEQIVETNIISSANDNTDDINTTATKKFCFADSNSDSSSSAMDLNRSKFNLPDEILQEIFACMPINDLLQIVNRVCWRFNNIISDGKFLRYKKLYYKYRAKTDDATKFVERDILSKSPKLRTLDECLAVLVWSDNVSKFRSKECDRTFDLLRNLSNFNAVKGWLGKNLLSDSFMNDPTIWNYVATFILLCDDVQSILTLLRILTSDSRIVRQNTFIDFFYCVLLYLAVINDRNQLAHRLHYNLYYALYLFENSGNKFCCLSSDSDAVSQRGHNLTYEQRHVVNYELGPKDCVRVVAFAGTGKTTTLLHYVKNRPNKRFLIIFFNKSITDDAKRRFPHNAECRTIHSIAKNSPVVSRLLDMAPKKIFRANIYNSDIVAALDHCGVQGISPLTVPALLKQTLAKYWASADIHLDADHAPDFYYRKRNIQNVDDLMLLMINPASFREEIVISDEQKKSLAKLAVVLWCKMKNKTDKFPMTHDGYLKLFQLSHPDFRDKNFFPEIDIIMVDEAQDCNPTTLDIVMRQVHPKIIVGDDCQQIYSFRGSVNALQMFASKRTFHLTQSFRFGPDIAYFAYCILNKMKNETRKILVGTSNKCLIDGSVVDKHATAIICRSNVQVFKECATLVENCDGKKLCLLGDGETLNFDLLIDLHKLLLNDGNQPLGYADALSKQGRYYFKNYKTLAALELYIEQSQEWQLRYMISIVKKFSTRLPAIIRQIEQSLVYDISKADFVVSTVHKVKGMEFDNVRLSTDFTDIDVNNPPPSVLSSSQGYISSHAMLDVETNEECNILYVAMTRAKTSLAINEQLLKILIVSCRESFQCLQIARKLPDALRQAENLQCVLCNQPIVAVASTSDDQLMLYRKSLAIWTGNDNNHIAILKSGLQCRSCFFQKISSSQEEAVLRSLRFYSASGALSKSYSIQNVGNISVQYTPFLV